MKFIKIYTRSQLVLLRSLNRLLGRYRLPRELMKRIDYILEDGSLGRKGFVLVLLDSVRDDVREIEDQGVTSSGTMVSQDTVSPLPRH